MFTDPIKNYPLAKAAIDHLKDVELVEFIGYTRQESVLLYNAVDAVIMTSFTEGSPQFIKEALACNTPIVSVNVGDVATLINGVDNCQLCSYDAISLSNALDDILKNNRRTYGHEQIVKLELDNNTIIHKIKNVYDQVAN
jgi:glycosyltransferase involved in cell wall biosynthesis